MSSYQNHVKIAIQATAFDSPTVFSWFGRKSDSLHPSVKRSVTPATARNFLLFNLQMRLYMDFYCRGLPMVSKPEAAELPVYRITSFVRKLSDANHGKGYESEGWEIRTVGNDGTIVYKQGLALRVPLEKGLIQDDNSMIPGKLLSVRFPKEFLGRSPGHYMALSDRELTQEHLEDLVRLYWHLTPQGAPLLMSAATAVLNQADIPFMLKVLNEPERFTRCDAGVLYIRREDFARVFGLLKEKVYPEVVNYLKPGTPAFTKVLADGVGLAEDPKNGDSFGLDRCRILADGMIRAYEQGLKNIDEQLAVVESRFAEDGISLETPFLNPGLSDMYNVQFPVFQRTQPRISRLACAESNTDRFLQTAREIAQRICQEAIWHGDRCNWLGAEADVLSIASNLTRLTYTSLGAELYDGTSGVALFLAELYDVSGDAMVRRTALGAIRQALSNIDACPPPSRLGFYCGWLGIAFAATRIGLLLNEPELLDAATQIVQRCVRENLDRREFDLISGLVGGITALIVLRDLLNDESLLEFAMQLGDDLIQTADRTPAGCSWKTAKSRSRNLTGWSHGTAGVAYAMLQLFKITGQSKYFDIAQQAFEYERYWFNPEIGNWPDFRDTGRSKKNLPFMTAWCHGAPGIALSRLHAYETLADETYKAEAIIALDTTRKIVESEINSGTSNFSLCHGLAGNTDVLLHASQILGQQEKDDTDLVHHVANVGIETYASNGHQWPSGVPSGGETPNLMLGLAGIGYFYLRLHTPSVPSVLILRQEAFKQSFCRGYI